MNDYTSVTQWMFQRFPMYQNKGEKAYKPGLKKMEEVLLHLNSPQRKFPTLHTAGTNGKGSTAHAIAAVLQTAGYRVGLYTSPHLKDFSERIKVNGQAIPQESVIGFIHQNKSYFESETLSFFEMTVAMAFDYFAQQKVDIGIIEVGLGGRLDATNVIIPELSVITNIGMDHTQFLGTSLSAIAGEKAGIIKNKVPVIIGQTQDEIKNVFLEKAKACSAPIAFADEHGLRSFSSDLLGKYQRYNLNTAYSALMALKGFPVTESDVNEGFLNVQSCTNFLGRWQELSTNPLTIADVTHNLEGFQEVIPQLKETAKGNLHFVLGFVQDKVVEEIFALLPKEASYYFCKAQNDRAMTLEKLTNLAEKNSLHFSCFEEVEQAFQQAKNTAHTTDTIYIGGSTFVVAEIL